MEKNETKNMLFILKFSMLFNYFLNYQHVSVGITMMFYFSKFSIMGMYLIMQNILF